MAISKVYMALLKYLKPANDRLPNLRGSLAASVPSCVIVQANLEVHIRYSLMVKLQYAFISVVTTNAGFTLAFILISNFT